ncbi:hypothetical protein TKK_0003737 [Trichogramma kaykai]
MKNTHAADRAWIFDLNYVDELGMTHLRVARVYSCPTASTRFLELGRVDPDRCRLERTGDSPLHLALDQDRGCEETTRLLPRHGADPNAANLLFDVANDEMGQRVLEKKIGRIQKNTNIHVLLYLKKNNIAKKHKK